MNNPQLVLIIKRGMEQGLTPLALANRIEKELIKEQPMIIYCADCHKEMEIIHQPQLVRGNGVIILATCRNPRCDLYTVTLTPEQLGSLTAEQLEAYRMMVRNMRELKD